MKNRKTERLAQTFATEIIATIEQAGITPHPETVKAYAATWIEHQYQTTHPQSRRAMTKRVVQLIQQEGYQAWPSPARP